MALKISWSRKALSRFNEISISLNWNLAKRPLPTLSRERIMQSLLSSFSLKLEALK